MNKITFAIIFSIILMGCIVGFIVYTNSYRGVPVPEVSNDGDFFPSTSTLPEDTVPSAVDQSPVVEVPQRLRPLPDELFTVLKNEWIMLDLNSGLVADVRNEYSVSYAQRYDEFRVEIGREPAETYRRQIEEDLRRLLNASDAELCTLRIFVYRRTEMTGDTYFQNIGLSFCEGSVSDEDLKTYHFEDAL